VQRIDLGGGAPATPDGPDVPDVPDVAPDPTE
jgi:hypothetical protein